MPRTDLDRLPDAARAWVFAASRTLERAEAEALLAEVDAFLEGWAAHGEPLTNARELREGRFLIVAVDDARVPPSGCSIDALVRALREMEGRLRLTLLDHGPVWYRDGEEVRTADRAAFRALARTGQVHPGTVVFDNTVTRLAQIRAGEWERPARESWHGKAFFAPAAADAR